MMRSDVRSCGTVVVTSTVSLRNRASGTSTICSASFLGCAPGRALVTEADTPPRSPPSPEELHNLLRDLLLDASCNWRTGCPRSGPPSSCAPRCAPATWSGPPAPVSSRARDFPTRKPGHISYVCLCHLAVAVGAGSSFGAPSSGGYRSNIFPQAAGHVVIPPSLFAIRRPCRLCGSASRHSSFARSVRSTSLPVLWSMSCLVCLRF